MSDHGQNVLLGGAGRLRGPEIGREQALDSVSRPLFLSDLELGPGKTHLCPLEPTARRPLPPPPAASRGRRRRGQGVSRPEVLASRSIAPEG